MKPISNKRADTIMFIASGSIGAISCAYAVLKGYTLLESVTIAVLCLIVAHLCTIFILLCFEIKKRTSRRKLKALDNNTETDNDGE